MKVLPDSLSRGSYCLLCKSQPDFLLQRCDLSFAEVRSCSLCNYATCFFTDHHILDMLAHPEYIHLLQSGKWPSLQCVSCPGIYFLVPPVIGGFQHARLPTVPQ